MKKCKTCRHYTPRHLHKIGQKPVRTGVGLCLHKASYKNELKRDGESCKHFKPRYGAKPTNILQRFYGWLNDEKKDRFTVAIIRHALILIAVSLLAVLILLYSLR